MHWIHISHNIQKYFRYWWRWGNLPEILYGAGAQVEDDVSSLFFLQKVLEAYWSVHVPNTASPWVYCREVRLPEVPLEHLRPASTGDLGFLLKTKFTHLPWTTISMDFPWTSLPRDCISTYFSDLCSAVKCPLGTLQKACPGFSSASYRIM